MKVSVCITVFNEEKSIEKLISSLLLQSKVPDEIIIVDGGSKDSTVEKIKCLQEKFKKIKLHVKICNRAQGRNLSVKKAKNEVIAITDADCTVQKNWLKRIVKPLENKDIGISAGFYKMLTKNSLQKAFAVFLGVMPSQFNQHFLPSTRSIAFKKSVWSEIGGFPEGKNNSAEDTDFNYKAQKLAVKFARVKNARVEWRIPQNFNTFLLKIYNYAKWDAIYGIWIHPSKGLASHNVKVLLVFFRYVFACLLLILIRVRPVLLIALMVLILLYIFHSYQKIYTYYKDFKAGLWGIVVQIAVDFTVMAGFSSGYLKRVSR